MIESRRQDYNANRPHRSLDNMTPKKFSATFNQKQQAEITDLELVHMDGGWSAQIQEGDWHC